LSEPIIAAIRFAYRMVRRNEENDISWDGPNIGDRELATSLEPRERLSADALWYALDDQGNDALVEIVTLAIQLGIEQGRRMARTQHDEAILDCPWPNERWERFRKALERGVGG
jgi:hypothetical protein